MSAREVLDGIRARQNAWYNGDDSEAEWSDDLDFVESYELGESTRRERAMAHEIVREDIPRLTAAVEAVLAVADTWEEDFPYKAWQIRAAIENALTKESP